MHEILERLGPTDRVLDLGSRTGSFPATATRAVVVRLDLDPGPSSCWVRGDARSLPFRDGCFAAVIANHSLEHFPNLDRCLDELGRVLRPAQGYLYVAVPDSSTVSDRFYRWLSHGGGHINAITNAVEFSDRLQRRCRVKLAATRLLHTSFAFANRNGPVRWSRRIHLVGGGSEWSLRWFSIAARRLDAWLGTRVSVYGWAFYLGPLEAPDEVASTNVCLRCGAAHVSEWLRALAVVKHRWWGSLFCCPECGAWNGFTDDTPRAGNDS